MVIMEANIGLVWLSCHLDHMLLYLVFLPRPIHFSSHAIVMLLSLLIPAFKMSLESLTKYRWQAKSASLVCPLLLLPFRPSSPNNSCQVSSLRLSFCQLIWHSSPSSEQSFIDVYASLRASLQQIRTVSPLCVYWTNMFFHTYLSHISPTNINWAPIRSSLVSRPMEIGAKY